MVTNQNCVAPVSRDSKIAPNKGWSIGAVGKGSIWEFYGISIAFAVKISIALPIQSLDVS